MLSVNAVLGVRDLDTIVTIRELPPLLQRASKDVVERIGTLNKQVLIVLPQAGSCQTKFGIAVYPSP